MYLISCFSTPLSYAWDLDGDGAFDDATGVSVRFTYNMAFTGVVGVKVTNYDNRTNIWWSATMAIVARARQA